MQFIASIHAGWSFRHGHGAVPRRRRARRPRAHSRPISSIVSRQSAVKPGIATRTRACTPFFARSVSTSSVYGLQPLARGRTATDTSASTARAASPPLHQLRGGAHDVRWRTGSPALGVLLRDAVEAEDEVLRLPRQLGQVVADDRPRPRRGTPGGRSTAARPAAPARAAPSSAP